MRLPISPVTVKLWESTGKAGGLPIYYYSPEPVELPIDGTLDLHAFRPADIGTLIPDYFEECRKRGITEVRLIHGKGTGTLRRSVHAILDRIEVVQHYRLADESGGSWGATLVALRRKEPSASAQ